MNLVLHIVQVINNAYFTLRDRVSDSARRDHIDQDFTHSSSSIICLYITSLCTVVSTPCMRYTHVRASLCFNDGKHQYNIVGPQK